MTTTLHPTVLASRQRILTAAENGAISFHEQETDATEYGVCRSCVWEADDLDPGEKTERCAVGDPAYRAATVEEVAAYIGAVP